MQVSNAAECSPKNSPLDLPTMSSQQTWLTQEAADRLAAELAHLEGEGRKDVTAKIEAARAEGDLKENGGYHAARDEQGKMEARIRQLKQMLENAHIGTPPASAETNCEASLPPVSRTYPPRPPAPPGRSTARPSSP